jgi:phosphate transport system permease protein
MKERSVAVRRAKEYVYVAAFAAGIVIALAVLAILLWSIVQQALPQLRWSLLTSFPSSNIDQLGTAGYLSAIVGTIWVVGLTLLFSLPLGIGAGIYLEEYAAQNRVARVLQTGVANLAGVPSVVFGLLGLALFVRAFGLGQVVLAASLTLTALVFPYVVITTQEAVRAVPQSIRDASLALGATKWQTIRRQVLPAALPGLLTGGIFAAARAMGETAPLIVLGSVPLLTFLPWGPDSKFVVLPVQIYAYFKTGREWQSVAAAGMVVLLVVLFLINALAIVARNRLQRQRW